MGLHSGSSRLTKALMIMTQETGGRLEQTPANSCGLTTKLPFTQSQSTHLAAEQLQQEKVVMQSSKATTTLEKTHRLRHKDCSLSVFSPFLKTCTDLANGTCCALESKSPTQGSIACMG